MNFDWDNFPHHDFVQAKKFASDFYKTIGRVKCPALDNEYISFNSKGMAHVLYKSTRKKPEIIERLSYLQYAESMVVDPFANIKYRQEKEKDYLKQQGEYVLCEVDGHYWSFLKPVAKDLIVKVVVRQLNEGNKYFYSIMKYERDL